MKKTKGYEKMIEQESLDIIELAVVELEDLIDDIALVIQSLENSDSVSEIVEAPSTIH